MNISFKQMQILNAVVVTGSISKATRLTNLSQPTISQQLAKMEEELGTQLLHRNRSTDLELTPAGEFWYRSSREMLAMMNEIEASHNRNYIGDRVALRFGTSPSLRRLIMNAAARIAVEQDNFGRFDFVRAQNSSEIIEMLSLHRVNCGVVSEASIADCRAELHVVPLFTDRIAWVVPKSVPHDVIRKTLQSGRIPDNSHPALARCVDLSSIIPWHRRSEAWYRTHIPCAVPFFSGMSNQTAIDFVAAGLATCHAPLSLIPNLPAEVFEHVQFFDTREIARETVFVMPRHLMSLPAFSRFQAALCDYIINEYAQEMTANRLQPMPQAN